MNREDLIQAHLHGRLDKKSRAEFDALYEKDPDFREEVQFGRDLDTAFSSLKKEELKSKLKGFEKELEPEGKNTSGVRYLRESNKNSTYKKWLAAACVLVVVGIGLMFFFDKSSPNELYLAHFEPYPNVVNPITRGENKESLMDKTFFAYDNGNYEEAAAGFGKLFDQTGKSHFLFYQANAFLANEKPEKAIPLMEKQLAFNDGFTEKSKWYLALAYLKTGETEKAKRFFAEITERNSYKAEEAENILGELK
jgi:hypothetical protein